MKRFLLTPLAEADLQDIKDYIARDSTTVARRVLREVREAMTNISESPGIGHRHEDLDDSLRVWSIYSYLIVYKPETRPVQILRVVHGARDFRRLRFPAPEAGL